jgi:ABC-type multidrug transport system, ATPase and permease components
LQDQRLGKEIRAYQADQFLLEKYRDAESGYLSLIEAREKALRKWSLLQQGIYLFEILLTYLVAVIEFRRGAIAVGAFLMYVGASQELFQVVRDIFDNFVEMSLVTGYYQDYLDYMNLKETMSAAAAEADIPKDRTGSLEFKNVSFTYPGQTEPAVRNVSFVIRPDEKAAFVGDNGAGKTTLIKLMLRLYDPTEGMIFYDGVDIRKYGYADYLKLFSCAFQDFRIFSYSLKENICFDDENPEKLQDVIDKTMLDRVIQKCPDGVDTYLGKAFSERSVELSGGEQQSVAIARAFYKDGRIAVFDEPTAALDPMKEHAAYEELNDFCEGRMAVFVSHRMGSTIFCNKIFVLDEGRIVEEGDHSSLMEAKGLYYDMYEDQACYYR